MSRFVFDREKMFGQLRKVFETYPTDISGLYQKLDIMQAENPQASAFQKKAWIYRMAAQDCKVRLMPACPFYMELDTGRDRNSITSTWPPEPGLATWLMAQNKQLLHDYNETWLANYDKALMIGGVMFADFAHHYADVERVLEFGLEGLKAQALSKLAEVQERKEQGRIAFYESMICGLDSVMQIAATAQGHSFRKTFGRQVYNMNSENSELALVKLMELFNHSSIAITKRYLGLRQEEILETYDCLAF